MADHRRVVAGEVVVLETVVEVAVAVLLVAELEMNPEANGIHPRHLLHH
jgi:hypothetical protein